LGRKEGFRVSTLDNLKKEAKRWLKALRDGDPSAWARLRALVPDVPATPALRHVQHALAREHGFESWLALKTRVGASSPIAEQDEILTALLAAADKGDTARVAAVLDDRPDLVSTRGTLDGHNGQRTALHFGVNHEGVVRLLLDRGADPNVRDEGDNAMPLHYAAESSRLSIITLLIEHGADPIGTGDLHELEVLGWATCFGPGDPSVVDYLLAHGAVHNIFSAVATGALDAIRAIAARSPADLDRRMDSTNHRRRPLHLAVVKKQSAALELLLDLGAAIDSTDVSGLTPLDQAALEDQMAMVELLVARGATLGLPAAIALDRSDDVDRLLHADPSCLLPGGRWEHLIVRAAARSSGRAIETLIRRGAAVNAPDSAETSVDGARGYTALHAAAWSGNAAAATVLLAHGADPTIRDRKYCSTPAGWANYAGHTAVRDLILAGPIDLFTAIEFDLTSRIPDILERDPDAIARPFRAYAPECDDVEWAADADMTPLAWAVKCGKVAAAELLVARGAAQSTQGPTDGDRDARERRFLELACWDHRVHGRGDHRMCDRAAQRLLQQHPEIARASLYTAIVCGEVGEVARILAERPEAATEAGGPRMWAPIVYLAFTRFSHPPTVENALAIARLVLDAGADPNAFYEAGDVHYSALVGVAGEGEQDSPRQPYGQALFQLLLERGAEPFDIQVLYNTHFRADMIWWLELVYAYTRAHGRGSAWDDPAWLMFDMGGYGPGSYFILNAAISGDNLALAEWALTRGAGPNVLTSTHPKFQPQRTHYQRAMSEGLSAMADLLVRHGAMATSGSDDADTYAEGAFIAACLRMDVAAVRARLASHPQYLRSHRAIFAAARRDRADVVGMLLDAGVAIEIENPQRQRPLHEAASYNALAVARLLVARGAEIDPREAEWGATPIGFAAYGDSREMLDFLSRFTKNIWALVSRGYADRLDEVLRDDPSLARVTNDDGTTALWWLPEEEAVAMRMASALIAAGTDPAARARDGRTAAERARERGMPDLARLIEDARS
jgi:uncharacterized protein